MANGRHLAVAISVGTVAAALTCGSALAASPRVESMIVGKTTTLADVAQRTAAPVTVRASGRSCRVGAGTPLAVLAAARAAGGPAFRTRDYGSCSKRPRDAGGLFVTQIGPDRNRGMDGWVYKVDGREGTTPAADPSGPFGDGKPLRTGQRVLWFWCDMGAQGCQRTLRATVARTVASTDALTVTVDGLDSRGKPKRVAGATVIVGDRSARTDASGMATVPGPWTVGQTLIVKATAPGLVPAFPEEVLVS